MPTTDNDLENGMSRLLQGGVALAAALMIAGGSLYLSRQGGEVVSYRSFHAVPPDLKTVAGVWRGVVAGQPASLIQFGVLVMIATPVSRVAFAVVAFCLERDWLYTGISLVVLGLLTWALLGAA
ncbi:MAG: DUF1634 domain-containing protein [Acidobacteriota bacterium]